MSALRCTGRKSVRRGGWRRERAFAEKFLHWGDGFMQALASPLPSFHPQDVLAGMAIAAAFYAAVYVKGKNAKKFRHNVEYGSARWSA